MNNALDTHFHWGRYLLLQGGTKTIQKRGLMVSKGKVYLFRSATPSIVTRLEPIHPIFGMKLAGPSSPQDWKQIREVGSD